MLAKSPSQVPQLSVASVEGTKDPSLVGYTKTGGCTKAFLSAKKACSQSLSHMSLASFFVNPTRGGGVPLRQSSEYGVHII